MYSSGKTRLVLVESVEERLGGSSGLATLDGLLAKLLLGVGSGVGVEAEQNLLVAETVFCLAIALGELASYLASSVRESYNLRGAG